MNRFAQAVGLVTGSVRSRYRDSVSEPLSRVKEVPGRRNDEKVRLLKRLPNHRFEPDARETRVLVRSG
jgi:hypothetical protein